MFKNTPACEKYNVGPCLLTHSNGEYKISSHSYTCTIKENTFSNYAENCYYIKDNDLLTGTLLGENCDVFLDCFLDDTAIDKVYFVISFLLIICLLCIL